MSEQHLTTIKFSSFDLPAEVLQGVDESGFSYCTPIQAETLPFALQGRDIAGQAQTGTGKTAAFLLAAYVHLLKNPAHEARKKRLDDIIKQGKPKSVTLDDIYQNQLDIMQTQQYQQSQIDELLRLAKR